MGRIIIAWVKVLVLPNLYVIGINNAFTFCESVFSFHMGSKNSRVLSYTVSLGTHALRCTLNTTKDLLVD